MGCSTLLKLKVDKPDPVGYFNYVAGYCIKATMNTLAVDIISPTDCKAIMSGEGVFYPSAELKKILAFGNKICDKSGMCNEDMQKAENEKFLQFLSQPEILKKALKEAAEKKQHEKQN